jgi:hypothetical protein
MHTVREEVMALNHSLKAAPKPDSNNAELVEMRNRRLAEVRQKLNMLR